MNLDLVLARPRARREPLSAVRAQHLLPAALSVDLTHVNLGDWKNNCSVKSTCIPKFVAIFVL